MDQSSLNNFSQQKEANQMPNNDPFLSSKNISKEESKESNEIIYFSVNQEYR